MGVNHSCSTAGLLVILSHLYPDYMLVFLYLLILDFASHWYHMYSSRGHHKNVSSERNFLLRFYYGVYPFFGFCCVGTELFYILLYVLHFVPDVVIPGAELPVATVRSSGLLLASCCRDLMVGYMDGTALLLRVPPRLRVQERGERRAALQRREHRGHSGRGGRQQGQVNQSSTARPP